MRERREGVQDPRRRRPRCAPRLARERGLTMPTIAVDAMGGDHAPEEVVKGVAQVSLTTDIECLLVGDEQRIQAMLEQRPLQSRSTSRSSTRRDAIGMARGAARGGAHEDATRRSWSACAAVAEGRADAVVSAGNTGACVLALREALHAPARHPARGARERLSAPDGVRGAGPPGAAPRRRRDGALRGRRARAVRAHGQRLRAAHLEGARARASGSSTWGARTTKGGDGAGRGAPPAAASCPASTSSATSRATTSCAARPT